MPQLTDSDLEMSGVYVCMCAGWIDRRHESIDVSNKSSATSQTDATNKRN